MVPALPSGEPVFGVSKYGQMKLLGLLPRSPPPPPVYQGRVSRTRSLYLLFLKIHTFHLKPVFGVGGLPHPTPVLCTWDSAQGFSVLLWVTVFCKLPQEVRNQFQFFPSGVPTPLSGFGSAAPLGTAGVCHPALAVHPTGMSEPPAFLCASLSLIHVFQKKKKKMKHSY